MPMPVCRILFAIAARPSRSTRLSRRASTPSQPAIHRPGPEAEPAPLDQSGTTSRRKMTQANSFQAWREGFGPIVHSDETVERVRALAATTAVGEEALYRTLIAADRLASAAMWTVVHMTYARRVDLSGAPLPADAFKTTPEGHTGGSLNMVPAFVGYLAANVLSATTRGWLMGQGHSVAAIEAVNALTGDVSPAQR